MTIELASAHTVQKPRGVPNMRPWSEAASGGASMGEIIYERPGRTVLAPALFAEVTQERVVALVMAIEPQDFPPTFTCVTERKLVPVTVMVVPPLSGPPLGATLPNVGLSS